MSTRCLGRAFASHNRESHVYSASDPDVRTIMQRKEDADLAIRQRLLRTCPPEDYDGVVALLVKRGVLLPRA